MITNYVQLAMEKGVKRFVFLSTCSLQAGAKAIDIFHGSLSSLGVDYTILRPTWLMDHFSNFQYLIEIQKMNKIVSATGEGRLPFVSADDVAAVGFHALTSPNFPMRDLVILGPELLSYDDVASIISRAVGRTITSIYPQNNYTIR
ncbi:hypothetical protein EAF04_000129 [Stromatinia cepivora]|nr:hypothetical protein EAF04_000129 [Stromatinia cepivora]